ncbi:DMT family transporter [Burkholderia sp. MSMB1589WGS]|uniref:DMT family transporter n=1 Tax=Burkholderia sp. MSMB1589WGS TaxID=1636425 RepID=UPI0007B8334B|nr:DMT family transporter [Burkholderia sp. MSMB1589WGS]
MRLENIAAYLLLAVTWGLSFLVILKVVHVFGWIGAVSLRALVASATLLVIAVGARRKIGFKARWRDFAVVGATTVAGQLIGLSFATPRIGTAMAAILVATIPLFSMIIGHMRGLERITLQGLMGLAFGIAGIVLLVGFPSVPFTSTFASGCVSSLLGSLCAAIGSNYTSSRLKNVGSLEVTAGSFLFGGLFTLPLVALVPVASVPHIVDYGYLLVLGSVMSGFAYVVYFKLVSAIGATRAISVEFAVTVVAVLVGALLLGENLSNAQIIGAVIIMSGCALVLGSVPGGRRRRVERYRPACSAARRDRA